MQKRTLVLSIFNCSGKQWLFVETSKMSCFPQNMEGLESRLPNIKPGGKNTGGVICVPERGEGVVLRRNWFPVLKCRSDSSCRWTVYATTSHLWPGLRWTTEGGEHWVRQRWKKRGGCSGLIVPSTPRRCICNGPLCHANNFRGQRIDLWIGDFKDGRGDSSSLKLRVCISGSNASAVE